MSQPRTSVIIRWIMGALVAGAAAWVLVHGTGREPNTSGVVGKYLGGFALMIAAGLLIAPEIIGWAMAPINYLLDSILMPSETVRPPVDYKLAHFYVTKGRYEEACEEYFRILSYHPREVAAYVEGIAAATAGEQSETARKFYRMGLRKLSRRNGERAQFLQQLASGPAAVEIDAAQAEEPPPHPPSESLEGSD